MVLDLGKPKLSMFLEGDLSVLFLVAYTSGLYLRGAGGGHSPPPPCIILAPLTFLRFLKFIYY